MPVTGYRFLVVGPDGPSLAERHRASTGAPSPTARTSGSSPASIRRRGSPTASSTRSSPTGSRTATRPTTSPTTRGPIAASRPATVPWDERPIDGPGALVEFYGGDLAGRRGPARPPRRPRRQRASTSTRSSSRARTTATTRSTTTTSPAHFGGDAALVSLRRATRERDIRLILDIAPNHTGVEHPWFIAAQADPAAPTAGYFIFRERPDDYASWLGVKSLPKLDYRDPGLRDAMYAAAGRDPPSLARAAVLGRRLADRRREHARPPGPDPARARRRPRDARGGQGDEPRRLPDGRALLRRDGLARRRPVGRGHELRRVHDAGPRLVHGAPVTACPAGEAVRDAPLTTDELVASLAAFRAAVPWAVARCQYDLLGSHDTARVRTRLGGDPAASAPRSGCCSPTSACPGSCTATRSGLEGANGDAARRTMPWDEADLGPRAAGVHAQRWCGFGRGSRALQVGRLPGPRGRRGQAGLPARHGRRAGDRGRVARGPGTRPAGAPSTSRTGRWPTGRRSSRCSAGRGRRSPAAACRSPTMATGRGDLDDGMSVTGLAGLRVRDARDERPPRRAAPRPAAGAWHAHDLEPPDPRPGDPIVVRVTLGPDVDADHVTCYATFDDTRSSRRPRPRDDAASPSSSTRTASRWDTLAWTYVESWTGTIPGQPAGTMVRYRFQAWSDDGRVEPLGARRGRRHRVAERRSPGRTASLRGAAVRGPRRRRGASPTGCATPSSTRCSSTASPVRRRGACAPPADPRRHLRRDAARRPRTPRPHRRARASRACGCRRSSRARRTTATTRRTTSSVEPRLGTVEDLRRPRRRRPRARHPGDPRLRRQPRVVGACRVPARTGGPRRRPRRGWFRFTSWPDEYETFFGVRDHPRIDSDDPGARDGT